MTDNNVVSWYKDRYPICIEIAVETQPTTRRVVYFVYCTVRLSGNVKQLNAIRVLLGIPVYECDHNGL